MTLGNRGGRTTRVNQVAVASRVSDALMDLILSVPKSNEALSAAPEVRSVALMQKASSTTAKISGAAALIPGPMGLLTILPDMYAIWRVQAQLVADIASVYGRSQTLGKEQMVWCLFKHSFLHVATDFVMQVGERYLVRRTSLQMMQKLIGVVGVKITQRFLGKAVARYLPFLGAAAVARYAYVDTRKVGMNAIALFSREIVVENDEPGVG